MSRLEASEEAKNRDKRRCGDERVFSSRTAVGALSLHWGPADAGWRPSRVLQPPPMVTPTPPLNLEYASAGANLTPGSAAWVDGGVLAYAAGPTVVLYDTEVCGRRERVVVVVVCGGRTRQQQLDQTPSPSPTQACRTLATLHGATARVNCVAVPPDTSAVAAGTAAGEVLVWRLGSDDAAACTSTTVDGRHPIVALAWHADTLAAAAGDGVALWRVQEASLTPRPAITLGRARRAHAVALGAGATPGALVLALGHVDGSVSVWLAERDTTSEFECAAMASRHGDWVRGVALTPLDTPPTPITASFLLATASNDGTARVWTLDTPPRTPPVPPPGSGAALDAAITVLAAPPRAAAAALTPVAVLSGHGDWVTAVAWAPSPTPLLLTTSAERSVRLWAPVQEAGATDSGAPVWLDVAAVGDAGVAAVGYVSGSFSGDGTAMAAVGPGGAVHVWRRRAGGGDSGSTRWVEDPAAGGHAGAVVDVAWIGDTGTALLTASTDMTARLHARVAVEGGGDAAWCEVGRPQVHGHPLAAVAPLPHTLIYASASEEKVVRVFAAPAAVVESLALAAGADTAAAAAAGAAAPAGAYGAAVPALGLSNKALHGPTGGDEEATEGDAGQYGETADALPPAAPSAFAGRPPHAHLAAATLWPETDKLYGHGSEVVALAAAPGGDVVASAADARSARHAAVRLWSPAAAWAAPAPPVETHTLTVTGLAWSPSGDKLLTVSRDRSWAVVGLKRENGSPLSTTPVAHRPSAHARALTAGAWTACGQGVVTAGRDGSVRVWRVEEGGDAPAFELPPADGGAAVTALATRPGGQSDAESTLLAAGTSAGGVQLWRVALDAPPTLLWAAPPAHAHAGTVHRLAFAPAAADGVWGDGCGRLASGGGDGGVKVWRVVI